jgi:hypothetical protein
LYFLRWRSTVVWIKEVCLVSSGILPSHRDPNVHV